METVKLLRRKDVPKEQTWDLSLIYPAVEDMEKDLEKAGKLADEIAACRGKLTEPASIRACLEKYQEMEALFSHILAYVQLAVSADYYDEQLKQRENRAVSLHAQMESQVSFMKGELTSLPEEVLKETAEQAPEFSVYLQDLLREKKHRLGEETEKMLAHLSPVLEAPSQLYSITKMADIRFPSFTVDGKEYPLGYSLYEDDYEYDPDTSVRREAFRVFSSELRKYENIMAAVYNTQLQKEKIISRARGFESVFDYLLFPQKVTREMYDRQIDLIMSGLSGPMRRYAKLLGRRHGLDRMTYPDLKIAVDPGYDPKITYAESEKYITEGLAVMGEDYTDILRRAYRERWVDYAKNLGKETGGFCESPYRRRSFILLSWNDRMSDVFTLAHELGHAACAYLCDRKQPYFNSQSMSTYLVEAPSTLNEILLANYLLKTNKDERFQRWVYSAMIQCTYYHNFVTHLLEADYQRKVYRLIDRGGSVQAGTLNALMRETLEDFWGDAVELPEGAELTWMRQPHYYMGLYSYSYSASLTVATQVCRRIMQEGQSAVDDWRRVMEAGGILEPASLARMAGVDVTTDKPLRDTISYISDIISRIIAMSDDLDKDGEAAGK